MSNGELEELREELMKACKVLYNCGVVDMVGHISARIDGERILIKPRPVSWFNLTVDDLIVMDFSGKRVDGPPSERTTVMEWPIHTEVYRARPDVRSVLHCHPTDSTLVASMDIEFEPLTRELLYFAGGVLCGLAAVGIAVAALTVSEGVSFSIDLIMGVAIPAALAMWFLFAASRMEKWGERLKRLPPR